MENYVNVDELFAGKSFEEIRDVMSMLLSQFSQEQHTMDDTIPAAECNEHIESEVADNVNCVSMSVMVGFKVCLL